MRGKRPELATEPELTRDCTLCGDEFGRIMNRAQLCHCCGDYYCTKCMGSNLCIKEFGYDTPVATCLPCAIILSDSETFTGVPEVITRETKRDQGFGDVVVAEEVPPSGRFSQPAATDDISSQSGGQDSRRESKKKSRQSSATEEESGASAGASDALSARRMKEREDLEMMGWGGGVNNGEEWYLVDASWLRQWKKFTKMGSRDQPPGPVSNHRLLLKDGRPAPGLQPDLHYRGINEKAWTYFFTVYGGGPALSCPALDIYSYKPPKDQKESQTLKSKARKN